MLNRKIVSETEFMDLSATRISGFIAWRRQHIQQANPTTVGIATVFLCLATGVIPPLITYFIAWIITPKAPAG